MNWTSQWHDKSMENLPSDMAFTQSEMEQLGGFNSGQAVNSANASPQGEEGLLHNLQQQAVPSQAIVTTSEHYQHVSDQVMSVMIENMGRYDNQQNISALHASQQQQTTCYDIPTTSRTLTTMVTSMAAAPSSLPSLHTMGQMSNISTINSMANMQLLTSGATNMPLVSMAAAGHLAAATATVSNISANFVSLPINLATAATNLQQTTNLANLGNIQTNLANLQTNLSNMQAMQSLGMGNGALSMLPPISLHVDPGLHSGAGDGTSHFQGGSGSNLQGTGLMLPRSLATQYTHIPAIPSASSNPLHFHTLTRRPAFLPATTTTPTSQQATGGGGGGGLHPLNMQQQQQQAGMQSVTQQHSTAALDHQFTEQQPLSTGMTYGDSYVTTQQPPAGMDRALLQQCQQELNRLQQQTTASACSAVSSHTSHMVTAPVNNNTQQQQQQPIVSQNRNMQQQEGMMRFRDKVTGRTFLVPTGPPNTQNSSSFSEIEPQVVQMAPVEGTTLAETFIADPKPILDVNEFLNIPAKHKGQTFSQTSYGAQMAQTIAQTIAPTIIAPDYSLAQQQQQQQQHTSKFEPITDDEEDEEQKPDSRQCLKFEPISDEEPEEHDTSQHHGAQVQVLPPPVTYHQPNSLTIATTHSQHQPAPISQQASLGGGSSQLPVRPLPGPPIARSRGKDLSRALQASHIEDISQSSQSDGESESDTGWTPKTAAALPQKWKLTEELKVKAQNLLTDKTLGSSLQTGKFLPHLPGVGASEEDSVEDEEEEEDEEAEESMVKAEDSKQPLQRKAKEQGLINVRAMIGTNRTEMKTYNVPGITENQCVTIKGVRRWKCNQCDKSYSSKHNLITHNLSHAGIKPHMCNVCSKTFSQPSHLHTHLLTHRQAKPHVCDVCHRGFTQSSHLKRHQATHLERCPHVCPTCGRGFTFPSQLKEHMEKHAVAAASAEEEDRQCEECLEVFPDVKALKLHRAMEHRVKGDLTCTECGKQFVYPSQLRDHMMKHENRRPYTCGECNMEFMKEHHLRAHEFTHTGLKPFVCEICNRAFNQKANLQRHQLIHQDEKLFKCDKCEKSFSQLQVLKAHQIVHADSKPFKCTICNKDFSRQHNLKGHMALHEGGKKYVCFCRASFTLKGNLNRHRKTKHGLDIHDDTSSQQADEEEAAYILRDMSSSASSQQQLEPPAITSDTREDDDENAPTPAKKKRKSKVPRKTPVKSSSPVGLDNEFDEWETKMVPKTSETGMKTSGTAADGDKKKRFLSFEEITEEIPGTSRDRSTRRRRESSRRLQGKNISYREEAIEEEEEASSDSEDIDDVPQPTFTSSGRRRKIPRL